MSKDDWTCKNEWEREEASEWPAEHDYTPGPEDCQCSFGCEHCEEQEEEDE